MDKAYVNFTHWAYVNGRPDDIPYEKKGFFVSWLRQLAYICQKNFPSIDLVIPMAFRLREHIDPDCMSGIFISVKNRTGTEDIFVASETSTGTQYIKAKFLSREAVEGIPSSENKRKADEELDGEESVQSR